MPLRGMDVNETGMALACVLYRLPLFKMTCKETQKTYLPNFQVTQSSEEENV
ncbi:hypothetical protein I79_003461 [Cricetulus griseus]|uniref:Uncharacterized protein n=1 Tax=Cricetulus griseus TaxID=10029 RepID=G3H013_CRIGR|nr:hypothetical protein I79_003461 [Cricetulus griseus]